MRQFAQAFAALSVCVLCAGAIDVSAATKGSENQAKLELLSHQIRTFQKTTWHFQRLMGVSLSPTTGD